MSVNKVILVGNVGKDPEVRYVENNLPVARFTLATSDAYRKNDELIKTTEWHNVVVWRNLAQVAEKYVKKGTQLYVEGKIQTRSYETNGEKKYITEIIGSSLVLLGKRPEGQDQTTPIDPPAEPNSIPGETQSSPATEKPADDLPF